MFVDYVSIKLKAGNGGDGYKHFLRDKFHVAGGPDGGNGGRGGHIYFIGDKEQTNLSNFYYKRKYVAGNGNMGGANTSNGKQGDDLIIKVPVGTVVRDKTNNQVVAEIVDTQNAVLILKGGKGGRGNAFFASSTRQTPNFCEVGEETKIYDVILELKLIADVGLVGMPNVGKSTILSVVSNARPKIANYHFTTLEPNLGVVQCYDQSFVVADIPGLIEGASEGVGLGHEFLRHIERTRMLVHVVDISGSEGDNPLESYEKINNELLKYSEVLAKKPKIIALNKCDLINDDNKHYLNEFIKKYGKKFTIVQVSAATKQGVDELIKQIYAKLSTIPKPEFVSLLTGYQLDYKDENEVIITIDEDGVFVVEGTKIDSLTRGVSLTDAQSFAYFQKRLRQDGIIDKLKEMGMQDGDEVRIKNFSFEYME